MKVLVGMSGGIDSSVAAYLLKKEGYDVEGITMLIWKPDSPYPLPASPNSCYSPDKSKDLEKIKEVSDILGIKHHTVDCSSLFESEVLSAFRNEYMNGRTPNPCIWCNEKIKFGAMLDYASSFLSFDYFATGHYARIEKHGERYCVAKAKDLKKDQSYFLSRLSQKQLSSVLFPLGDYLKSEIREIDESLGFHEKGQSESQDFYGGDYSELLNAEDRTGDIVFEDGRVLGHHKGYWHYTMGQRKGLGIALGRPVFVTGMESETNTVILGDNSDLFSREVISGNNMMHGEYARIGDGEISGITAKIRYAAPHAHARIESLGEGRLRTVFEEPQRAATPGQSVVFYRDDLVIGGGIIEKDRL